MFAGHDHNNDYSGIYKGIELVFGRKTGYGSYGPKTNRGATVIKIKEFMNDDKLDFKYDFYIIEQDGSIIPKQKPSYQGYKHF